MRVVHGEAAAVTGRGSTAGSSCSSPRVLDYIDGDATIWEREPLERLAARRAARRLPPRGFWQPMDTLRDKRALEELWEAARHPGRAGDVRAGVYSRPPRLRDRPHRVQGIVAQLLADAAGREVTGYALEPPTEPEPLRVAVGLAARRCRPCRGGRARPGRLAAELARGPAPESSSTWPRSRSSRLGYAEPRRDLRDQRHGDGQRARGGARLQRGACAAVVVTSDKCYENRENGRAYREDDPLGGHDPYSASKGCAELVTAAYRASFFAQHGSAAVATARAGNVIGGGDWARRPDRPRLRAGAVVAARPSACATPTRCGPGSTCWSLWRATFGLAARLPRDGVALAGPWNFGPTDDDAARRCAGSSRGSSASGGVATWTSATRSPADRTKRSCSSLDTARARELRQWAPVWQAEVAVRRTAAWYSRYDRCPGEARSLVDDDLLAYGEAAIAAGLPWALAEATT